MNSNNRIVQEIAFQFESGNPLWGLLFMNEYLPKDNWLRQAIITKGTKRLNSHPVNPELLERLTEGAKAETLTQEERAVLGTRVVSSSSPLATITRRDCTSNQTASSMGRFQRGGARRNLPSRREANRFPKPQIAFKRELSPAFAEHPRNSVNFRPLRSSPTLRRVENPNSSAHFVRRRALTTDRTFR